MIDRLDTDDAAYRRSDILAFASIVILALSLRIYAFPIARVIAADGISYVNIARSIFRGEGFAGAVHYPPFFPLLIGMMNLLTGDDELAGKLVSLIMGTLLVIPVYLIAKNLFSRQVAVVSSLLVALSPSLAKLSSEVLTQSTYLTLVLSGLYCFCRACENLQKRWAISTGLLLGAAYLTRPEAIIILVAASSFSIAPALFDKIALCRYLRVLGFIWLAFVVMAAPYILLLHQLTGDWQLSGKSSVTLADALGWYLDRPDLKREPSFAGIGYLDVIRNYPDFLWKNPLRNIKSLWSETLPVHVWLLMFLGMVAGRPAGGLFRSRLLILAGCAPLVVLLVFFFLGNVYTAPFLPFFLILAAQGLVSLQEMALTIFNRIVDPKSSLPARIPFAAVAAGVIGTVMFLPHVSFGKPKPYHYTEDGARYDHKLIGKLLKQHLPPRSTIMARDARLSFYADMPRVDIPQDSLAGILSAAQKGKARYIVADGTLSQLRPQMEPLLTPLQSASFQGLILVKGDAYRPVPGLKLVLIYKDPASAGVAVYEIME